MTDGPPAPHGSSAPHGSPAPRRSRPAPPEAGGDRGGEAVPAALAGGGAAGVAAVAVFWRYIAFVDPAIPLLLVAGFGAAAAAGVSDLAARAAARRRRRRGGPGEVRRAGWAAGAFAALAVALGSLTPWGGLYGFLPIGAAAVAVAAGARAARRALGRRFPAARGREERLRLTPAGAAAAGIAGALLLGAFLGPSNMLLLVFSLVLGPVLADGYFAISTLRRCDVDRRAPAVAAAGEVALVEVTVSNRSRLPATQIVATDRVRNRREDLPAAVRFGRLPARGAVTGVYRLRPMTRGRHVLGPIALATEFPLGLVRRESVRPAAAELLVLPAVGAMRPAWHAVRRNADELVRTAAPRRGLFEDEFYQLREYRPGDGPTSIHWRSSAKAGELMVREARESRDRDLAVLLDLHAPAGAGPAEETGGDADALAERAVSAAATVVADHLRRHGGARVSLRTLGAHGRAFAGRTGGGDPTPALRELALAEAGPVGAAALTDAAGEAAAAASPSARRVWVTTRPPRDAAGAEGWEVLSVRPGHYEQVFACP